MKNWRINDPRGNQKLKREGKCACGEKRAKRNVMNYKHLREYITEGIREMQTVRRTGYIETQKEHRISMQIFIPERPDYTQREGQRGRSFDSAPVSPFFFPLSPVSSLNVRRNLPFLPEISDRIKTILYRDFFPFSCTSSRIFFFFPTLGLLPRIFSF